MPLGAGVLRCVLVCRGGFEPNTPLPRLQLGGFTLLHVEFDSDTDDDLQFEIEEANNNYKCVNLEPDLNKEVKCWNSQKVGLISFQIKLKLFYLLYNLFIKW